MRTSRKGRPRLDGHKQENATLGAVDDLAQFEEFKATILPIFKKALQEGWSQEKIYAAAETAAAVRGISIALTEEDSGKAMSAIKDILDRNKGKARERQEVTHTYSKLKDDELDSLLQSQLKDMEADEEQDVPNTELQ